MALEMEGVATSVEAFAEFSEDNKELYHDAAKTLVKFLKDELPAFCEMDRAAVANYVSRVFSALAETPLRKASDIIVDTAVTYQLAAAILLGMLPE